MPLAAAGAAFVARAAWRAGVGAYQRWADEKARQAAETPETDDDEAAAIHKGAAQGLRDATKESE